MTNLAEIFNKMQSRFDAQAAEDIETVIQYQIDDSPWQVLIAAGECSIEPGLHDDPNVTLKMDEATLVEVFSGELDGMQAFMTGRIQAEGDVMLAARLATFFPE